MLYTASDRTSTVKASNLFKSCPGPQGIQGIQGSIGSPRGNMAIVDAVYGNDSTASIGGTPFLTISSAISTVSSGQCVWILPGTYTLTSPIVIPSGVSMRGIQAQTSILQMNVTASTTMITMSENSTIQDLTINLNATGTTDNISLTAINLGGTTTKTSKILNSFITINNSTMSSTLTNTVTGVLCNGTGTYLPNNFTYIALKACSITVLSNGAGNKRNILINNTNSLTIYDCRIYMAQPTATTSTGSYVGIETADASNTGSIQIKSSSIGCVVPTSGQSYTANDILQTNPTVLTNPSYLASAGIQIGPGTDLITKTAGSKGFSTYVYPTIIYYGLKGNISSSGSGAYLWPGTMAISAGVFPDPGLPPAFFRIQQPCLMSGLSVALNIAPSSTYTTTLLVRYTPISTGIVTDTIFTVTFTGTDTYKSFYNGSLTLNSGDLIHLYITYTGASSNTSHDITAQIDLF
jgi:hypothetical protein